MNTDEIRTNVGRSVAEVLRRRGVVSAVEVLIDMGVLSRRNYEDWRMGRIPFLEQAIGLNLAKLPCSKASSARATRTAPKTAVPTRWRFLRFVQGLPLSALVGA